MLKEILKWKDESKFGHFLSNSNHKNVDLDIIHALKNFSILLYLLFLYLNMETLAKYKQNLRGSM